MQNSFIIFQKLLVLFGFMLIGYLSYKKKWISDDTSSQISGLIVNIFNPALIISGVIGSVGNGNWNLWGFRSLKNYTVEELFFM